MPLPHTVPVTVVARGCGWEAACSIEPALTLSVSSTWKSYFGIRDLLHKVQTSKCYSWQNCRAAKLHKAGPADSSSYQAPPWFSPKPSVGTRERQASLTESLLMGTKWHQGILHWVIKWQAKPSSKTSLSFSTWYFVLRLGLPDFQHSGMPTFTENVEGVASRIQRTWQGFF